MSEDFIIFKTVLSTINTDAAKATYDSYNQVLDEIIEKFQQKQEAMHKYNLLVEYSHKMEAEIQAKFENVTTSPTSSSTNQDNTIEKFNSNNPIVNEHDLNVAMESYTDENGINAKIIHDKIISINQQIAKMDSNENKKTIKEIIEDFNKYNIIKEMSSTCINFSYKSFECEMCLGSNISCKGRNYKTKKLGSFSYYENNVLYFFGGQSCGFYNRKYYTEVVLECGSYEKVEFSNKIDYCGYRFVFNTRMACNVNFLNNLKNRIKLFLSEV